MKRALLSVSDKEGIVELAQFLRGENIEIVSSGGTRKVLEEQGIKVTPIEEVTGNPEAFGGRMKTLSFQISSALLFRRAHAEDESQAKELGIDPIDLVVCNLYPFDQVVAKGGEYSELIENIDIGGPTMVRAAAKNHDAVTVLTHPSQYARFREEFNKDEGTVSLSVRKEFALSAFEHTADYDALIAQTLGAEIRGEENILHANLKEAKEVRYGENPHQRGFVLVDPNRQKGRKRTLASAPCLQGKELSYNNYLDADAAWRCNSDLHARCAGENQFTVTIIKHANPCGAAISSSQLKALSEAWRGDDVSAFGSIIAFNKEVSEDSAQFIAERFVEVVLAPSFSEEAKALFAKKKNLRLIELSPLEGDFKDKMVRTIDGGFVIQDEDNGREEEIITKVGHHKSLENKSLMEFGLTVTKHLKSNAIGIVGLKDGHLSLWGAGMGNPNRRVSLEQAVAKARENGHDDLSECLLISDAFFPFRDNIDLAASFGLKAIIQPGGSIKDKEVLSACEEKGIAMAFSGMRHFRH